MSDSPDLDPQLDAPSENDVAAALGEITTPPDGTGEESAGDPEGGTDPLHDLGESDGEIATDHPEDETVFDGIYEALRRSPEKSIHDIDQSEYFDPETGGQNRVMLAIDDIVTQGDGLENWMLIVIGVAEMMIEPESTPFGSESSSDQDSGEETFGDLIAGDGT